MYYMGAMSADDILRLEDRNPVDSGDRYFVQQNLIPADRVDDTLDAKTKPPAASPATANPEPPQNDARGITASAHSAIRDAMELVIEARIGTMLKMELDRARRGKASPDYFQRRTQQIEEQMKDQLQAVATGLRIPGDVSPIASAYAEDHCDESQRDLTAGTLDGWQNGTRARTWAKVLLDRVEELICSNCEA
jgi:hypothetical protein